MTHKELTKRFYDFGAVEWDKQIYIEYLTIMNYMPDEDFNNMLNIKDATDAEFMSILDFYYRYDCYLMLFKLLRDNRKDRLVNPDVEEIKNMQIRDDFEERQKRFFMWKETTNEEKNIYSDMVISYDCFRLCAFWCSLLFHFT